MALPPTPRLSGAELAAKVQDYERFANDVLKVDLKRAVEARSRALREVDELEELRRTVHVMREVSGATLLLQALWVPLSAAAATENLSLIKLNCRCATGAGCSHRSWDITSATQGPRRAGARRIRARACSRHITHLPRGWSWIPP